MRRQVGRRGSMYRCWVLTSPPSSGCLIIASHRGRHRNQHRCAVAPQLGIIHEIALLTEWTDLQTKGRTRTDGRTLAKSDVIRAVSLSLSLRPIFRVACSASDERTCSPPLIGLPPPSSPSSPSSPTPGGRGMLKSPFPVLFLRRRDRNCPPSGSLSLSLSGACPLTEPPRNANVERCGTVELQRCAFPDLRHSGVSQQ